MNIWDFWAKRYNRLWVQKYSLKPTREYLLKVIDLSIQEKILDLGCGPGELIQELYSKNSRVDITGLDSSNEKYNIIISTHSLPYWKNPDKVLKDIWSIIDENGKIYIGFASGNSFYDKLALFFVKFTTGPANYPSDKSFRELVGTYFEVEDLKSEMDRIKSLNIG